ncbi:hypothetical protein BDV06DRAFT_191495 [Aspergillus oleicola]
MTDKRSEPSTVPSGTTGTSLGNSQRNASSGESSSLSRIDDSDSWRIGGPGSLPAWPLTTIYRPQDIDHELAEAALDISLSHLNNAKIPYEHASVCRRATTGQPASSSDVTILIRAPFKARLSELVSLLDDILQVLLGLNFDGRVEIIDPLACGGLKTFAPVLSQQQQEGWNHTITRVTDALEQTGVDWRLAFAANRGYFFEESKLSVVVKASKFNPGHPEMSRLREELADHGFKLALMGVEGLWGLFGALAAGVGDDAVRNNLGWPISPSYHGMGLSIGRASDASGRFSTLGGYIKLRSNNEEHTVGLTCYHGVRPEEGNPGETDMDRRGATGLSWPCHSPAPCDIQMFAEPLRKLVETPIPQSLPPPIKAEEESKLQESRRKLQEIERFDPFIGNVSAVSGWRNRQIEEKKLDAPFLFTDWACVTISKGHCPYPANAIHRQRQRLLEKFPEALDSWKTDKSTVNKVAPLPHEDAVIFKQGRTTGLTAGTLAGVLPASYRLDGLPGHIHHRAFIVVASPHRQQFALPGDSGAWCLDGNGDLVGQLVGGDKETGAGLMIPFSVILNDIEMKLGLEPGSVSLA